MNKNKIIPALIMIAAVVLFGVGAYFSYFKHNKTNEQTSNVNNNTNEQKFSFTTQIIQSLNNGATVQEIGNPNLTLPADIISGQIEKYFRLDNILFALVLRNSMNVVLSLPAGFTPTFSGILVAEQGTAHWTKLAEVREAQATDKNNPYYLTVDKQKLLVTIVDQNGSGSGEGIEKIFSLTATGNWMLQSCYYFGASYSDPTIDGDYFAYSIKFSSQTTKPTKSCDSIQLIPVTNIIP